MKYLILILCSIFILEINAQQIDKQVISAYAADQSNTNYQITSTAGENIVETFEAGTFILCQGFQQVDEKNVTAIDKLKLEINYELYPIPAQDVIFLNLISQYSSQEITIQIIDVLGKIMDSRSLSLDKEVSNSLSFDLSRINSGIYFIKIMTDFSSESKTIQFFKK